MPTAILGLSAYFHDSAACLLIDGQVVAAAQEERFTRTKNDARFPIHAAAYCLSAAKLQPCDLDFVAFYEKPFVKFERLLETYVATAPQSLVAYLRAMPEWLTAKLWLKDKIRQELDGYKGPILFGDHHESHAASAFYPSPFEEAAVLTVDGVGEWSTASIAVGNGSALTPLYEQRFPHSLGLLYSAFTAFLGFKVNSGEYKVMGLAPYGEPRYVRVIKDNLLHINDDGSLWLNQDYFTYTRALSMTGREFAAFFDGPARQPEGELTQREMDIARSVQIVCEEVVLKMSAFAKRETGLRDLCLAGGVALNCVANGRLRREGLFEHIWIPPAPGDAGGAVGVAFSIWHRFLGMARVSPEQAGTWRRRSDRPGGDALERTEDGMARALLGPAFNDDEIVSALSTNGLMARRLSPDELSAEVAVALQDGKVVGLLQGRMEFGPRALGARSILADPRPAGMRNHLNHAVKLRETFRPFAPAVLREHAHEWFLVDDDSPYMHFAEHLHPIHRTEPSGEMDGGQRVSNPSLNSPVPAVTHLDYSARLQTVGPECGLLYEIISEFHRLTGCPMVVNTSFNVRGEPLVCTPVDAIRCFSRTNIDVLVLESFVVEKSGQSERAQLTEQVIPRD